MLIVFLAVLLFAQIDSVCVEHDRFKNITTVTTRSLSLKQPKTPRTSLEQLEAELERYSASVTASFTYSGKTMKRSPRFVTLNFYFHKRYFPRSTSLIALVDGERLVLPSVSRFGESRLPIQTFRRLTKGKSIELQIGYDEFTLPDETVQALKEIERKT